jgi:hypothetical protein
MICPNCKKEIDSSKFCKFCGEKIKKDNRQSTSPKKNSKIKKSQKILIILWLMSSFLVFIASFFRENALQHLLNTSTIIDFLVESFIGSIIGMSVGAFVGVIVIIASKNFNKGFIAGAIATIVFNLFLFLNLPKLDDSMLNVQENVFISDNDGFQIIFPNNPEIEEINLGELKIRAYGSIDNNSIKYFVKVGEYDNDFTDSLNTEPALVEYFLSKFPQNLFLPTDKNPLVVFSDQKKFFNEYQGIEYKYKSEINGSTIYRRGIFFIKNGQSFQISINYPDYLDPEIDERYNTFKESLELKK